MSDFTGKVVAIVGAATPIGAGAAVLYAKSGGILILCDLDEKELNEVVTRCQKVGCIGDRICTITGDPSESAVQSKILEFAEKRFKRLDILVNALETKIFGSPVPGISVEDFNESLDKNLKSVASMCLTAVPLLRKAKGNIVNVSSYMGQKPVRNHLSYCVSKAGLDMLTKGLALDLAPHGIRVNSVNPGVVLEGDVTNGDLTEFVKATAEKTPMGRLAGVDEVTEAILYLSSNKASFTTGQLLGVDGGAAL